MGYWEEGTGSSRAARRRAAHSGPTPLGQAKVQTEQMDGLPDLHDLEFHEGHEGIFEHALQKAFPQPLCGQQEVDEESERWFKEWLVDQEMPSLPWPHLIEGYAELPPLHAGILRKGAMSAHVLAMESETAR